MWHFCAAGQSPLCPTCPRGPGGTDKGGHHSHRVLTDSGQLLGVPRSTQKSAVRLPRDMASHTQVGTPVQVKLAMMSWFLTVLFQAQKWRKVTGLSVLSKASGWVGEQPVSTCQQDAQLVNDMLPEPQPLPSLEEHRSPRWAGVDTLSPLALRFLIFTT